MNCADFEHRLETHGPDGLAADALTHSARCARCARALDVERRIEVLLASPPDGRAAEGFTDRVLDRIERAEVPAPRTGLAFVPEAYDARPFWARLLAEPAVLAALALAVLLAFAAGPLLAVSANGARALAAWWLDATGGTPHAGIATVRAAVPLAEWAAAAWVLTLVSLPLLRWVSRVASAPLRAR